jgi:hypothetical protein
VDGDMSRAVKLGGALIATAALASPWATPAQAGTTGEHPGCKGIDQAYSKASDKGKAALAVVSDKFGCGSVDPTPTDPVACPTGQSSLARWTYAGTLGEPFEFGYPTWTGAWTNTAGTGAAVVVGDGGGFYWSEATANSVQSIVLQSMTGEVVTVTDSLTYNLDPANAVSQNWFTNRTGINSVNFCG